MTEVIQHILFPDPEAPSEAASLFFHGDGAFVGDGAFARDETLAGDGAVAGAGCGWHLRLAGSQEADFVSYLNSFSLGKWRKYTRLESVSLTLAYAGEAELRLIGASLVQDQPVRTVLGVQKLSAPERTEIRIPFPDCGETLIGFEIRALAGFELFGGAWAGTFPEDSAREIELSIATTTFRREDYIRRNMRRLQEELISRYPAVGAHIRVHVVDNGRTLTAADLPGGSFGMHQTPEATDLPGASFDLHQTPAATDLSGDAFTLHPNPNTGGSGGYARGMIETLHQTPEATHILLMDDDVEILPDSIFRTYQLLRFAKDEYREHFISGAMLMLEEKNIQHEDIGSIRPDGGFRSMKPRLDHSQLRDNLINEAECAGGNMFQGWWYCCMPVSAIREHGLPLPLFIRGDDVEYSLRCRAKIMSMNGICLWHLGFYRKFNAAMDLYQRCRNLLIAAACTESMRGIDAAGYTARCFRAYLLKYGYDSAELIVRALEDFLRGPKYLAAAQGEAVVRENSQLNDRLVPLSEFEGIQIGDPFECFRDKPWGALAKVLYRVTWNGHRLWPMALLKKEPAVVAFDQRYQPSRMTLHRYHLMVNPYEGTGRMLEIDRGRYRELRRRFGVAMGRYRASREELERAYSEAGFTEEAFWREYLGLQPTGKDRGT